MPDIDKRTGDLWRLQQENAALREKLTKATTVAPSACRECVRLRAQVEDLQRALAQARNDLVRARR